MKKILHIDMDCFYAQVEMRDRPELQGLPIAIGGIQNGRGVLCTSNYEARKFGVHSAMPTGLALKKCPHLVLIAPNFEKYRKISEEIFQVFKSFSDKIERISLDEAYIDLSECKKFNNDAIAISKEIKRRIYGKTGLTASVGISYNKYLSKIASDLKKPNGLVVLRPEGIQSFIDHLKIEKVNGVGKSTLLKMHSEGLYYLGDLKRFTKLDLINRYGEFGVRLYGYSRGIDERKIIPERQRKSLSVEKTFSNDVDNIKELYYFLRCLYEELDERLRAKDLLIKGIFIKFKRPDFTVYGVQRLDSFNWNNIKELFHGKWDKRPLRLLGIGVRFHYDAHEEQLSLPL